MKYEVPVSRPGRTTTLVKVEADSREASIVAAIAECERLGYTEYQVWGPEDKRVSDKQAYLMKLQTYFCLNTGTSIPETTRWGIADYVCDGLRPGGFLSAVLSNDLKQAFERADHANTQAMAAIVGFLYNHAPSACWGSEKAFEAWIKGKADTFVGK